MTMLKHVRAFLQPKGVTSEGCTECSQCNKAVHFVYLNDALEGFGATSHGLVKPPHDNCRCKWCYQPYTLINPLLSCNTDKGILNLLNTGNLEY